MGLMHLVGRGSFRSKFNSGSREGSGTSRRSRLLCTAVAAGIEPLEKRVLFAGYSITDLGTLAGGSTSEAHAINAAGSVTGFSNTDTSTSHAFTGAASGLTDVATLGGVTGKGLAINSAGLIVGQADNGNGVGHAFLYDGTNIVDLGVLPGGAISFANAINDGNAIVGGAEADFSGGPTHAFFLQGGAMTDLGTLTGNLSDSSVANGINISGQIVGTSDFVGERHAFLYANGLMTDLGVLVIGGDSEANAINDFGIVVGDGTITGGNTHALRYSGGQFSDLGALSGDTFSSATAINLDGDIVGFSNNGTDANSRAFLYSNGTLQDLNSLLPSGSGWVLQKAFGVNASDQVVGFGTINGEQHAFLLTPNGPDTTAPQAQITASDVTIAGGTSTSFTIAYSDAGDINPGSINAADVSVTGPGGQVLAVTDVTTTGSGGSVTATYTVAAVGGTWDSSDNGIYTITLNGSQVLDASNNAVATASVAFNVNVATPPPALDPTFGGGSISANFVAEALITDANGKILLAGHQRDSATGTNQAVLERLNADGSVDATFGKNGAIVSSAGANDAFYSITQDDAGRIYAAGTQNGNFMVARFKANGVVDNRFGNKGRAVRVGGTDEIAYGVALGAGGSIVVAGGANGAFAFARFLTSGSVDFTFGTSGLASFAVGTTGDDVLGAVAIDSQGRIVAAGGSGGNVVVIRLTAAGAQDPTFDGGNAVTLNALATRSDLGGPDRTVGLAVQADDRILVANRTPGGDFGLVRLLADATLDNDFANHGVATVDFGGDDDADIVTLQGTGQIFVIGTTDAGGPKTAVATFNPDGSPDTSFNGGGKYTADASGVSAGEVVPRALHVGDLLLKAFGGIQPNGKLVVGTPSQSPSATATPLRRLNVPGSGSVGMFGVVNGKNKTLTFQDADLTKITLSLKNGGTGTAFYDGTSIDLVFANTTAKSDFAVTTKGGDKRVRFRDIRIAGSLRSYNGAKSDLSGTFFVDGFLGRAAMGNLTGTIAASGLINSLSFTGNVTGAKILSGANLGTGGKLGGSGTAADTYGAGAINSIQIAGRMTDSVVGAGADPMNGAFRDADDTVIGGAASRVQSVVIRHGIDGLSRLLAGSFGIAKIPLKVVPAADGHFEIL